MSHLLHDESITTIDQRALYQLLSLRLRVFGDEQGIKWSVDLDGRDVEPTTRHIWMEPTAKSPPI